MKQLPYHNTEDTAFIVPRFPFCFGQYTSARYWVENKHTQGQRLWTQYYDTKHMCWFKAKNEVYHDLVILLQQDDPNELNYGLVEVKHIDFDRLPDQVLRNFFNEYELTPFQAGRISNELAARHAARLREELQAGVEND